MPTTAELGKKVKARYPGQYDDIDDQTLGTKVKAKYPQQYGDFADSASAQPAVGQPGSQNLIPSDAQIEPPPTMAQKAVRGNAMPTAGGLAGAMAAGPLVPEFAALGAPAGPLGSLVTGSIPPIAGAITGGAGLEAIRQLVAHAVGEPTAPQSPTAAINEIGNQGMWQGINELGGRFLTGGAQKVLAPAFMRLATHLSPESAGVALREGILATKGGLEKLEQRWIETTGAEAKLATAAGGLGLRARTAQLADQAYDAVRRANPGLDPIDLDELQKLRQREMLRDPSATPSDSRSIRQYHDTRATSLYDAREGGRKGSASLTEQWHKAMADQHREWLQSNVPGIKDPAVYQKLTGSPTTPEEIVKLKNELTPALTKSKTVAMQVLAKGGPAAAGATYGALTHPQNRVEGGLVGAGEGAALGAALSSPALSLYAHAANNPVLAAILSNIPRAVGLRGKEQQ